MKLITKEVEKTAKKYPLYSQEKKLDDAVTWLKFFHPMSRYRFYVTEASDDMSLFFGYCISPYSQDCDEWGYVSLDELESVKEGPLELGMERDMYFDPITVKEVKKLHQYWD